jgi:ArsR family transcriptional regulator
MTPVEFYKCLAEETRLKSLLLITLQGELCVCDLMDALEVSQPKVSRHLAELRKCELLVDERRGKWVYYQLNPKLPSWSQSVLQETASASSAFLKSSLTKLKRAQKSRGCC